MLKVVRWEIYPLPLRHYPLFSATTDDVIARAAIYQWLYELFVLQSISGLLIKHNVLDYVAIVTSGESVFCWRKWIIEHSKQLIVAFSWTHVHMRIIESLIQIKMIVYKYLCVKRITVENEK
jgi:hypothetical protein